MTDNTKKIVKTKEDLEQDVVNFIYGIGDFIKNLFWIAVFFIVFFFVYMGFMVR